MILGKQKGDYMAYFFTITLFLSFVAFLLGMINPSIVIHWGRDRGRDKVWIVYGSAVIISFILIAMTVPKEPKRTSALPEVEVDQPAAMESPQVKPPPPPSYASTDFRDFDRKFGTRSKMTELQKSELFDQQYEGKPVKWAGRVAHVDKTWGDYSVQVKHLPQTFTSDVIITMKDSQADIVRQLSQNDKITYVGIIVDRGDILGHSVHDGEIIEINGKPIAVK